MLTVYEWIQEAALTEARAETQKNWFGQSLSWTKFVWCQGLLSHNSRSTFTGTQHEHVCAWLRVLRKLLFCRMTQWTLLNVNTYVNILIWNLFLWEIAGNLQPHLQCFLYKTGVLLLLLSPSQLLPQTTPQQGVDWVVEFRTDSLVMVLIKSRSGEADKYACWLNTWSSSSECCPCHKTKLSQLKVTKWASF